MASYPEKPSYVPFEFMLKFEEQAKKNHCDQDIEKLNSRGGMSPQEVMLAINGINGRDWDKRIYKDDASALAELKRLVTLEYPDWKFQ